MNPDSPTSYSQFEPKKSHKALKATGAILITLLLLGLAAYSVYAWMQNTQLANDLSKQKDENKALMSQHEKDSGKVADITEVLPNGKTAVYPDNEGNRNMLFWHVASKDAANNLVLLSHKKIQAFLSGVDSEVITAICGTDTTMKAVKYNISIGILNTDTKTTTSPQNSDCVTALASDQNKNATLKAKAQAVIDGANNDMKAFVESVTIK